MRERLALVGGRLRVEAAAGTGTTIAAEVPVS
jgi:signal transduction histidine kinase